MDLLLSPKNPLHPPFEVVIDSPEHFEYDLGDFFTYPERQGWTTRTRGEWYEVFEHRPDELAQFLEKWLLLGTIHAFFGDRIHLPNLIRPGSDSNRRVLTLEPIRNVLRRTNGHDLSTEDWASVMEVLGLAVTLHQHLLMVSDFNDNKTLESVDLHRSESLATFIRHRMPPDPRDPELCTATALCLEILLTYLGYPQTCQGMGAICLSPPLTSFAWKKLREDGWCPSDLATIFHRFNTSAFLFLHDMLRPRPNEKHQLMHVRKRGQAPPRDARVRDSSYDYLCTGFHCRFTMLDDVQYSTKHVEGCFGCRDVAVDPRHLSEILKNRRIPLILSLDESDENEYLTLIEADDDISYVAISHVWSDGLGNPRQNALPRCQLLRLSNYIRNLEGECSDCVLFWIDTICVPPDSAGMKEEQDLAIGSMRATYENATTVLVLDSWLYNSTGQDKSASQNLLKIFSSKWTSRLWTYQEGALAQSLHIQFADTAINLETEVEKLMRPSDPVETLAFAPPIMAVYHQIRFLRRPGLTFEQRFSAICSALQDRTTSVASDEPLCFGTLLDLDVVQLAQTSPEKRMQKLWTMLPSIPLSVLDLDTATLDTSGFRWAPRTFLRSSLNATGTGMPSHPVSVLLFGKGEVNLSDRGLMIQRPGILVASESVYIGSQAHFRVENDHQWYIANFHHRVSPRAVPYDFWDTGKPKRYKIQPSTKESFRDIGIILDPTFSSAGRESASTPDKVHHISKGHLVAVYEETNEVIYCESLCTLSWQKATSVQDLELLDQTFPRNTGFYGEPCLTDKENGTLVAAIAQTRRPNQVWCIG